jgi:hypothetical protein
MNTNNMREIVKKAATIKFCSGDRVNVPATMQLAGFSEEESKEQTRQQQVRRLVQNMESEEKGGAEAPPVSSVFVSTEATPSMLSARSASSRAQSTISSVSHLVISSVSTLSRRSMDGARMASAATRQRIGDAAADAAENATRREAEVETGSSGCSQKTS